MLYPGVLRSVNHMTMWRKSAWDVFQQHAVLLRFLGVREPCDNTRKEAEEFVCMMYSSFDESPTSTDALCCMMFSKGKRELDYLPPIYDAVELHIKRAYYQTPVRLSAIIPIPEWCSPIRNWLPDVDGLLQPTLMRNEPSSRHVSIF